MFPKVKLLAGLSSLHFLHQRVRVFSLMQHHQAFLLCFISKLQWANLRTCLIIKRQSLCLFAEACSWFLTALLTCVLKRLIHLTLNRCVLNIRLHNNEPQLRAVVYVSEVLYTFQGFSQLHSPADTGQDFAPLCQGFYLLLKNRAVLLNYYFFKFSSFIYQFEYFI